ncbi:MAG: DUF4123 domain-containing protein [Paucibacter sp.]|nr:DUF4123 domain-containing protein [Roseateles sp.]
MASAQAPAQLKSRLWADAQQQVYALIMGSRVPTLPARLAEADVIDHDCLLPGALDPVQAQNAPYLVQLRADSAFTDWLLLEAGAALGDWGLVAVSAAPRLALRSHWRSLLHAQLPEGQSIELDWMDPEIFWALLPLFDAAGLARFFGPVSTYVQPGAMDWRHARLDPGGLQQVSIPLARAA